MNRIKAILVFAFVLIWPCCCLAGNERPNWPKNVLRAMHVPPEAKDIWYDSPGGLFKLSYRADVCYPARSLIREMAAAMRSQGWAHLAYDPINEGIKLPPEYPDNDHSWLGWYPWDSVWKDSNGNVVWYDFGYDVPNKLMPKEKSLPVEYFEAVKRSCSLFVGVTYFPPDALHFFKKAAEEANRNTGRIVKRGAGSKASLFEVCFRMIHAVSSPP